jgi:two-component system LytT family response regulator
MNNLQNLFIFPGIRSLQMLKPSEIIYLKSDSNYTYVYMENGKHQFLSKTLKNLEACLPESIFLRIHQSYVVNTMYIRTLNQNYITLTNDKILPVSRRKKKYLLDHISCHCNRKFDFVRSSEFTM